MLKATLDTRLKTAQLPTRLCFLRAPRNMVAQALYLQRKKCMQDESKYGAKHLLRARSLGLPSGCLAPMTGTVP